MSRSDIIADSLTVMRNAVQVRHDEAIIPYSKVVLGICEILKNEGYILNYKEIETNSIKNIKIYLKYDGKQSAITKLQRISRPGRRIYVEKDKIPVVCAGYGVAILSTSSGILKNSEAKKKGVGGEVLCYVW